VVCGFFSPFHPGGTIAYALSPFSPDSKPPSLARQIRWANQMVSAIHHLHRVAYTYYGDIKLDNVVLSIDDDAVFIDFEQARHAEGCLAPEARGNPGMSFPISLLRRVTSTPLPPLLSTMSDIRALNATILGRLRGVGKVSPGDRGDRGLFVGRCFADTVRGNGSPW